jgi:hypothetical protein
VVVALPDSKLPLAGDADGVVEAVLAGGRVDARAEFVSNENSPGGVGFRALADLGDADVAAGPGIGRALGDWARSACGLADAFAVLAGELACVALRFAGLASRLIAGLGSGSRAVATQ